MRIVDIRETAIPLKSDLKNSSIDFSEMTTSVVAVITDVIRDIDAMLAHHTYSETLSANVAETNSRWEFTEQGDMWVHHDNGIEDGDESSPDRGRSEGDAPLVYGEVQGEDSDRSRRVHGERRNQRVAAA